MAEQMSEVQMERKRRKVEHLKDTITTEMLQAVKRQRVGKGRGGGTKAVMEKWQERLWRQQWWEMTMPVELVEWNYRPGRMGCDDDGGGGVGGDGRDGDDGGGIAGGGRGVGMGGVGDGADEAAGGGGDGAEGGGGEGGGGEVSAGLAAGDRGGGGGVTAG